MTTLLQSDYEFMRDVFVDPDGFPTENHDNVVRLHDWAEEQLA